MAYIIYKADGTTVSIADNSIDTAFYNAAGGTTSNGQGIGLVGRNTLDYGATIAQNFLQMTENFASATNTQPIGSVALQGQLWFDKSLAKLYVRTTAPATGANSMANWREVFTVASSETIPVVNPTGTPKDGDIQVVGSVISIYAAGAWKQVFPAIYS